ncbi:MAG: 30S ribosomal protein S17 [Armatimonadetes bacterium]|nr:30S ribosomal protein S17 [Armatimonadota bacterium]NIM24261.1 30S ribosomal protein S17 [Armatimonadota bacterium]NIM68130.1 30S ribosomal protein S17 [Armatimonadota bacterium]NIM76592.1 30S ribosomal protein S17 [Armatimonadota bacterium]NIN06335.1 30S ribosomal protein S17 [Armatimonadota bacterium]
MRETKRKQREGLVVSDRMDKTVVVRVDTRVQHPLYKRVVKRSTRFKAHDENNECNIGDKVRIMESRPLSATKNWRVVKVLERAK